MEKIHERLRAELQAHGLTAAEAARRAGEGDSQGLRDVLSGRKRLSADLLAVLTTTLELDAVYILTGVRAVAPSLKPEHKTLIDDYEGSSVGDQAAIRQLAKSVSRSADSADSPPSRRRSASGGKR